MDIIQVEYRVEGIANSPFIYHAQNINKTAGLMALITVNPFVIALFGLSPVLMC